MIAFTIIAGTLAAGAAGITMCGYASERRHRLLNRPLADVPPTSLRGLRWRTEVAGVVASATVLDVLVALVRIDPKVLDAIDRAHGARAFESFDALQAHVVEVMSRGENAFAGLVSQYKGSLAEILVAEHLTSVGHTVDFAESPNQVDWDLMVDGSPAQVKGGVDGGGIVEAIEQNPDIHVFTVQEHAGAFPEADVTVLPLSGSNLTEVTAASLEGIADFGELAAELPFFAVLISLHRNLGACSRGEVSIGRAATNIAMSIAKVGFVAGLGDAMFPGASVIAGWLAHGGARRLLDLWEGLARTAPPSPSKGSLATPTREARRQRRKRFDQLSRPLIKQLDASLRQWQMVAVESAQAGAREAREAARRCDVERRWFDDFLPRRSLLVAEAAVRRYKREAQELEELAAELDALDGPREIHQRWQAPMRSLAHVSDVEEWIEQFKRTLDELAKRCDRDDRFWWRGERGERSPLVVASGPLDDRGWGRQLRILGSVALLLPALIVVVAVQPKPGTEPARQRTDSVRAAPAPPPVSPPQVERVQVNVPRCRVRSQPSTEAAIVGRRTAGATCELVGWTGAWAEVRCDEVEGFMHKGCLAR